MVDLKKGAHIKVPCLNLSGKQFTLAQADDGESDLQTMASTFAGSQTMLENSK